MNADDAMLLSEIRHTIRSVVREESICVAFSGGVDSCLMTKICAGMGYKITLGTVGFPRSHDIVFAREAGKLLGLPHRMLEIEPASFSAVAASVDLSVRAMGISWIENCIAFHYISELASGIGLSTVVTANGIDELFCGYDAYRRAFSAGPAALLAMIDEKIENERLMMEAVGKMAARSGVEVVQPLLSPRFVSYARKIPLSEKITGLDDLVRKHIIRRLALEIGIPTLSASKRKKALQYGTGIHKVFVRYDRTAPPCEGQSGRQHR